MRKTGKSALYNTIKGTIKKLGISEENTTGIINYIKFMESSMPTSDIKTAQRVNKKTVGSAEEEILSVLNENPSKPYAIQDVVDITGFSYPKVQILLRGLRTSRKVKIVEYVPGSGGPSKVLYQTWKSPLKALKFVTEKQGYSTVNGFIKNNKKLLAKGVGIASFASIVEDAGLPSYPLALSIGVSKGYKNSDLKKLALGSIEDKPKRKYTKRVKANKPKRKYTKRAKAQPVGVQVNQEVQSKQLNLFSFFRRRKDSSSDLIKF